MVVPKFVGRDCELSTTGVDAAGRPLDSWGVTCAILDSMDAAFEEHGLATWSATSGSRPLERGGGDHWAQASWLGSSRYWAQSTDCLRHWAPNGASFYSDCSHVEAATAESLSPRRFAADCFAALAAVEAARQRADLATGNRYSLSTSNVDALDPAISWGTHWSAAVSVPLWEDLIEEQRHPALLGFVASALAAAVPFFGTGYLLPLRDGSTIYSLSGRAHHLTKLKTHSTTEAFRRGLLNARREPHVEGQERLHLICFDFALASAALCCSFLQCTLAAAEEGLCGPSLFDPLRALQGWSWNIDLRTGKLPATALLVDGRQLALPAYLREVTSQLLKSCEAGLIPAAAAPEALDLLPRLLDLTHYLEEGSLRRSALHLDWASKLLCLIDLCDSQGAVLGDALTRLADHDFANTDPDRGLFWRLWDQGLIDPLIDKAAIAACLRDGPPEGRGWGRGRLIQRFRDEITDVDWSYVELRRGSGRWDPRLRIQMPRLDSLARDRFESILEQAGSSAELEPLLKTMEGAKAESEDPGLDIRSRLAVGPVADRLAGASGEAPQ